MTLQSLSEATEQIKNLEESLERYEAAKEVTETAAAQEKEVIQGQLQSVRNVVQTLSAEVANCKGATLDQVPIPQTFLHTTFKRFS